MNKLVLCLPLAPHEMAQADALIRLWVDIEPDFNDRVIVAIALRFDMNETDVPAEWATLLRTKFSRVVIFKSALIGTGWPHGCNALEIGAYQWFVEKARSGELDADYVFLTEADTVPLRPTWLREIYDETHQLKAPISGAYFTKECGVPHINGNCVMHMHFWKECREIWSVPPCYGWDVYIGTTAIGIGKPSRLIWQDYRLGAADNPWRGDDYLWAPRSYNSPSHPLHGEVLQPAFLHGVKTLQGIDAVRKRYGLPERK